MGRLLRLARLNSLNVLTQVAFGAQPKVCRGYSAGQGARLEPESQKSGRFVIGPLCECLDVQDTDL